MSKRKTLLLLTTTGLIAYTGFLLANLPAALVWQVVPANNKVELQGISGTIWSGQASQVTIRHKRQSIQLPIVTWQWQPSTLLSGALAADISVGNLNTNIEATGTITYGSNGITAEDIQADTSARWITQLIPQKLPGDLSANVSLTANTLTIDKGRCINLDGVIKLNNSAFKSPSGSVDLGNSSVNLTCKNSKLMATINQQSPDIQTRADLTLSNNGHYSVSGSLSKGESLNKKIEQGLQLLGSTDKNGRYSLNFSGKI